MPEMCLKTSDKKFRIMNKLSALRNLTPLEVIYWAILCFHAGHWLNIIKGSKLTAKVFGRSRQIPLHSY